MEKSKYIGYSRALRLSLRKLLGSDDITDATYQEISEKLTALMKPEIYRTILRDICGFKYNLNYPDPMLNPGMFELYKKMFFKTN